MATLTQVVDAAETVLAAGGLRVAQLGEQVHPPCVMVSWNRLDYSRTMADGLTDWDLRVRVYIGQASSAASSVAALAAFLDPTSAASVKQLLEADGTLGGVVEDTFVSEAGPPNTYTVAGVDYLGAEVNVLILAP